MEAKWAHLAFNPITSSRNNKNKKHTHHKSLKNKITASIRSLTISLLGFWNELRVESDMRGGGRNLGLWPAKEEEEEGSTAAWFHAGDWRFNFSPPAAWDTGSSNGPRDLNIERLDAHPFGSCVHISSERPTDQSALVRGRPRWGRGVFFEPRLLLNRVCFLFFVSCNIILKWSHPIFPSD